MRQALHQLLLAGQRLYGTSATLECAEAYRRAVEVSGALRDRRAEVHARFWQGAALQGAGRLREALAVMAPPLAWQDLSLADADVYRLVTRYLLVLTEIPAERVELERAIDEVEAGLARDGARWRSRILVLRTRIALASGEWREMLRLAEEALVARDDDESGYTRCSYYWPAVLAAVWLGELDLADRRLEAWARVEPHLASHNPTRAWLRSCWLRRAGRPAEALSCARDGHAAALRDAEYPVRFAAQVELVKTLLALGEVEAAREPLGDLLRFRSAEVAEHAYVVRVMVGDWHLGRARELAGLPAIDPDFDRVHEPGRRASRRDLAGARAALERARRAYERAARRGRRQDALRGCDLRGRQIAARVEAVCRAAAEALPARASKASAPDDLLSDSTGCFPPGRLRSSSPSPPSTGSGARA